MKRINIAVASPGDVSAEREAVPKVTRRWNDRNDHVTLHPVMWESASVPTLGDHPQHILDKQIVDKSELLVAILWSKLGTPTPSAPSGTVEEIREFIRTKGAGRVMLYFCTRSLPYSVNPAELAKIQEFKAEIARQGLYHEYTAVEEFERDLYQHLDAKVSELLEGKLRLPEADTASKSASPTLRQHPDSRLRDLIDFGASLQEISSGFETRMDQFDSIDGSGRDKYLDLGAHVYNSVAFCLDRFLLFSAAGIAEQDTLTLERISSRLKRLGAASQEYLSRPFPQYWSDGRKVFEDLDAHVKYLSRVARK